MPEICDVTMDRELRHAASDDDDDDGAVSLRLRCIREGNGPNTATFC